MPRDSTHSVLYGADGRLERVELPDEQIRPTDLVGSAAGQSVNSVSRLGGDEFMIIGI